MSVNVPLRAEFVSSFVVSAALLCLDVQTELVQRHVVPLFDAFTRAEFDATAVTLTLLFLNLAFVFSPTYARASKGSTNNPTVYVLRIMLGEINATLKAILNATASVLAHACSFAVVMWTAKAFPWALPGKAPMVPLTPNGGFKAGASRRRRWWRRISSFSVSPSAHSPRRCSPRSEVGFTCSPSSWRGVGTAVDS